MCKEAILTFMGHDFIRIFSIADTGYNAAILNGEKKSYYTGYDERKDLRGIKEYIEEFEYADETINPYHDNFMDKIKWIISVLSEELHRAVKNKAIKNREWLDLLKWWFDNIKIEFDRKLDK